MQWLGVGIAVLGAVFGVVSEQVAFGWGDPRHWVPDLVVGVAFLAAGAGTWSKARGTATLLLTTGYTWFLANVAPAAIYWHRGLLIHLLLCYPGWRPRTTAGALVVGLGYLAAVITPVWRNDLASAGLSAALVSVAWYQRARSAGNARHHTTVAAVSATAYAAVLVVGDLARLAWPAGDAVAPSLWAYLCVLVGIAIGLVVGVRRKVAPAVVDLVVELGQRPLGDLRGQLARVLGDPSLELGYWQPDDDRFVDIAGRPITPPRDADARTATYIHQGGHPFAVLIHDRAVLADPSLLGAVGTAARLTATNAELNTSLRQQVGAVAASRRRLLLAADDERRRLEQRLRDGAVRRLTQMHHSMVGVAGVASSEHLRTATDQLELTIDELAVLAQGLHPRELTAGLHSALTAIAARNAVPVRLTAPERRFPAEVEVATYYTCAEALANVTKHAAATSATIEAAERDGWLTVMVSDDGRGGADPSRGTGLRGLADRIESLGGQLIVESVVSAGTRLIATIPLG
jgi:signal transduction histidine kinase